MAGNSVELVAYKWQPSPSFNCLEVRGTALLLALALIYHFGSDVTTEFRFISPGNVVAAILIAPDSIGFRFCVSKFGNYSATYGNLAAMIILMLSMYFSGTALLTGSEINAILYRKSLS